jgi:hypothetical protein
MASAIPTTMRALAIQKYSKPSGYEILELPVPGIKNPKDILVKVRAASINPVDVKFASGLVKMMKKDTFVPHTSSPTLLLILPPNRKKERTLYQIPG